jgi:hypothetical protein
VLAIDEMLLISNKTALRRLEANAQIKRRVEIRELETAMAKSENRASALPHVRFGKYRTS